MYHTEIHTWYLYFAIVQNPNSPIQKLLPINPTKASGTSFNALLPWRSNWILRTARRPRAHWGRIDPWQSADQVLTLECVSAVNEKSYVCHHTLMTNKSIIWSNLGKCFEARTPHFCNHKVSHLVKCHRLADGRLYFWLRVWAEMYRGYNLSLVWPIATYICGMFLCLLWQFYTSTSFMLVCAIWPNWGWLLWHLMHLFLY